MKPANLTFINHADFDEVVPRLRETLADQGLSPAAGLHFTNGTYAYDAKLIVPTMLAGFKYIDETYAAPGDALVIAANSTKSMLGILDKKGATPEEKAKLESQYSRAEKVALPLAQALPGRKIIVLFYDEETPTPLYNRLAVEGFNMGSLHKWGYGTNPDQPRIEGADLFKKTFGFPLINDPKPLCHDITAYEDQSRVVHAVKLHETKGANGRPYISTANKVLFSVPPELAAHAEVIPAPLMPVYKAPRPEPK